MRYILFFNVFVMCMAAGLVISPLKSMAQDSGVVVYKRVVDLGDDMFYKDTLRFNSDALLFVRNREARQWRTDKGWKINIKAQDSRWHLNQRTLEITERIYNAKKDRYERRRYKATPLDWEIHDEFKTVGAYQAQKATVEHPDPGKGLVTAWFTTEVPISGGPSQMWGLPGLIVRMSVKKTFVGHYELESINLKPVQNLLPTKGVMVEENGAQEEGTDKKVLRDLLNNGGK